MSRYKIDPRNWITILFYSMHFANDIEILHSLTYFSHYNFFVCSDITLLSFLIMFFRYIISVYYLITFFHYYLRLFCHYLKIILKFYISFHRKYHSTEFYFENIVTLKKKFHLDCQTNP